MYRVTYSGIIEFQEIEATEYFAESLTRHGGDVEIVNLYDENEEYEDIFNA